VALRWSAAPEAACDCVAVLLDKDGTVLIDVPYNVDPARMELAPQVAPALRWLQDGGFLLIVVSNQSGVARGLYDEDQVITAGRHLTTMLAREGIDLAGYYYCPHLEGGSVRRYAIACECRKPRPELLFRAAREHGIDLGGSWMVGDILDDVEAGNRAGCRTILLDVDNETQWAPGPYRSPDHVVSHLAQAASIIMRTRGKNHATRCRTVTA
jgi:D-glycero-D-manno-heptose 1,7-bisphosphate phosphatase